MKEEWILTGLNKKLERILQLQSEEGWFPEYGGADIGYLSVSLDMLAEYYHLYGSWVPALTHYRYGFGDGPADYASLILGLSGMFD